MRNELRYTFDLDQPKSSWLHDSVGTVRNRQLYSTSKRPPMIAQLTRNERQGAILISLAVALCGLVLGLAGRDDPIGLHGALIFVAGALTILLVGRDYYAPEPSSDRFAYYYDDPSKVGIIAAMVWVVFGLAIGDWAAWQLVNP